MVVGSYFLFVWKVEKMELPVAIEEVLRWKLIGVNEVDKQRKGEKTEGEKWR